MSSLAVKRVCVCVAVAGCALAEFAVAALGEEVHVQVVARPKSSDQSGGDTGQGTLFRFRDDCFAFTAAHVLGEYRDVTLLGWAGRPLEGTGWLLARFQEDLALLRVHGPLADAAVCKVGLSEFKFGIEELSRGSGEGTIAHVESNRRAPMRNQIVFRGADAKRVVLTRAAGSPGNTVGQSGALVYLAGKPAGILLGGESEFIGALPIGRVVQLLEDWFSHPTPMAADLPLIEDPVKGAGPVAEDGNLLSSALGAAVLQRSAESPQPQWDATKMLESGGSWVVKRDLEGRAWAELRLAGRDEVQTLACVVLAAPVGHAPKLWASVVKLSFSISGNSGDWEGFGTVQLFSDGRPKSINRGAVRARYLRLEVHGNHGDPLWIAVGQLKAYSKAALGNCQE